MRNFSTRLLRLALFSVALLLPIAALSAPPKMGIVVMHGKGGSPAKHVADLAGALEDKGYLVANIEMTWSGKRDYDADVAAAEAQVDAALKELRAKGAQKVFVAGHSQGGVFALHLAGKLALDGVICMAPGGDVGSRVFRENLAESVARAKQLVAEGKGGERVRLDDYEGKKGKYPIDAAPALYLQWFDPDGAMSTRRAAKEANPQVPILWIVPKRDYPGLKATNVPLFAALPKNPATRLYEPDASHLEAPSAALEEILRWTAEVAASTKQ